jgi:protein-tyrosine kinase
MITEVTERTGARKRSKRRSFAPKVRKHWEDILDRLPWPCPGSARAVRSLGLTSCCRGEGVSTMAAHLAATAASYQAGRVLLVDANLAHPSVARTFDVVPDPGLAECLRGGEPGDAFLQACSVEDLWILAAGKLCGSPARAFDSPRLPDLVRDLARQFDLVIFDMPSAGQASCITRLAGLLDGVLLVVEAERVGWEPARRAKELLVQGEAQLLGAVLNKHNERYPSNRW